MKVLTVVGARPQFIKAGPVCRAFQKAGITEYLVHTGQHYDYGMSDIFFKEMQLPVPSAQLAIGSGSHGQQTGAMLAALEKEMLAQKPDWVLVYGDTNSTLAGALAACKLQVPLAHVEAGLRSFNRSMPEEHNRVLTDHAADILFCPTQTAMEHLKREGLSSRAHWVGDTMYDAILLYEKNASDILERLSLKGKSFYLATIHRPYNTDTAAALKATLECFEGLDAPLFWPVHPRTKNKLFEFGLSLPSKVNLIEPLSYFEMLAMQKAAICVLTDSGGIQKEAFLLGTPCVTLRSETEWVETVECGWNKITGTEPAAVRSALEQFRKQPPNAVRNFFGSGDAAEKIVRLIMAR